MNETTQLKDQSKLQMGGWFAYEHYRNGKLIDKWEDHNIVTDEGINFILDSALSGGAQDSTYFLGVFKNNYTPLTTSVASTFAGVGVANEATTEYSQATRPAWAEAGVAAKTITNSASPATFSFTVAGPTVLYGAFLISDNTKGGVIGTLIAASKFAASRSMVAGDDLKVTYTLVGSSA